MAASTQVSEKQIFGRESGLEVPGARVMSKGFARPDPKVLIQSKVKRFALCSPPNTQRTIKLCTTSRSLRSFKS